MADENININIDVNTNDASKTIGDLKKEFKDLKTQLSDPNLTGAQFKKLSKELNDVEGALGDMNDAAKAASGSGIEQLKSSTALLQEGFTNFDTGKMQIGFKAMGAAMKAIPIFLIIEGVKFLIEKFDELTKSNGFLGDAFKFIGLIIDGITQAFKDLSDAIGLTTFAADEAAEAQIKAAKAIEDGVTHAGKTTELLYDRQIELAKAMGKSTKSIEIEKQNDIIKTANIAQDKLIEQFKESNKLYANDKEKREKVQEEIRQRTQEQVKILTGAEQEKLIIEANANNEANKNYKKSLEQKEKLDKEAYEKRKKLKEKEAAEEKQRIADYNKFYKDQYDQQVQDAKDGEEEAKTKQEIDLREKKAKLEIDLKDGVITKKQYLEEQRAIELANENLTQNEIALIKKKNLEQDRQLRIKEIQDGVAVSQSAFQSAQGLSDALFSIKMANIKKGSKEEENAARQQFKINKALSISTAVMQGAQSVLAITAVPDFTLGIASALRIAAVAATTGATVAKIAATQFQATGSSGSSSSPSSSGGSVGGGTTAQFQAPTFFGLGQVTGPNDQRTAGPQRVYVTEGDISKVQNRVSVIESRARIS